MKTPKNTLYYLLIFTIFYPSIIFMQESHSPYEYDDETNTITFAATEKPLHIDHEKEIVFAQSGNFTGHFSKYAHSIRNGINALFKRINNRGGISGRKLRLISIDDFGRPETTKLIVDVLKEKYNVEMFFGNMGTRSIMGLYDQIKNNEIALFFPWGGHPKLRDPQLTSIVNGPGLIEPQLNALVDYTLNTLNLKKIGIFHADGSFSAQAAQDLSAKLKAQGAPPVAVASYNRLTLNFKNAADKLIQADPKIVICLSTSMPTVKLINRFFEKGHFGTTFMGIDSTLFVKDIAGPRGAEFYFTSAVPSPQYTITSIIKSYQRDIVGLVREDDYNVLSLTYYLAASIIVHALKKISDAPQDPAAPSQKQEFSKEKIISAIESMQNVNLNGITISFDKTNRHAFGSSVTIIKG